MAIDPSAFDRFSALVRRELGAGDVRIIDPAEVPPDAPNVAYTRLDDARTVVVTFEREPEDIDALRRRLAMLVDTFAEALSDPGGERFRAARTPVSSSLFEELRALLTRAQAVDVVVIDADSPIVWGSARGGVMPSPARVPLSEVSHPRLVSSEDPSSPEIGPEIGDALGSSPFAVGDAPAVDTNHANTANTSSNASTANTDRLVGNALTAVRTLAERERVHKGKTLRHSQSDPDSGYLVLSFSGIYLLVLVYEAAFDELRAERAAQEALPRIERLVLALPPLDPEPQPVGQVISLKRRR